MDFEEVKQILKLEPLDQEGGWFNRIYGSGNKTAKEDHLCGSSIYFALCGKQISKFHRLDIDEIWIYHAGTPGIQILLFEDGHWEERIIGCDLKAGQVPQSIIPAGTWQATSLIDQSDSSWGLFACVGVPGFEYKDFHMLPVSELIAKYPDAEKSIREANLNDKIF